MSAEWDSIFGELKTSLESHFVSVFQEFVTEATDPKWQARALQIARDLIQLTIEVGQGSSKAEEVREWVEYEIRLLATRFQLASAIKAQRTAVLVVDTVLVTMAKVLAKLASGGAV